MLRFNSPRASFSWRCFSSTCNGVLLSLLFLTSKGNSENMLLFLFHGTEFRVVFSPAAEFGTEFRDILFRRTAGIPSEITLCSVFRGIIFLSEIPNPTLDSPLPTSTFIVWRQKDVWFMASYYRIHLPLFWFVVCFPDCCLVFLVP